jgi:hypothetical protein
VNDVEPPAPRRFPGPFVLLVMALVIAAIGTAIYLGIRPDPTLPIMTKKNSGH